MKTNPTPLLGTLKYLYQYFTSPFYQVRLLFLVCLVFQSVLLEKVSYFLLLFHVFYSADVITIRYEGLL